MKKKDMLTELVREYVEKHRYYSSYNTIYTKMSNRWDKDGIASAYEKHKSGEWDIDRTISYLERGY